MIRPLLLALIITTDDPSALEGVVAAAHYTN
jgi:hypothetical protein